MKVEEIVKQLDLNSWNSGSNFQAEISSGFASDLLSHVIGFSRPGQIWFTCQVHRNIVAVATLKDIPAIVLVNFNRQPDPELVNLASEEGVILLSSEFNGYELSGKLFALLNKGSFNEG